MIPTDPEPYVHFDFLRMLGKGGTHLLTLGYGPIITHPDLSIIFYYVEGEGKMGFCKEDRDV
jgi:hypothetical protein